MDKVIIYQKKVIKKAYLDSLFSFIFLFVLSIIVLIVGLFIEDKDHSMRVCFGAAPMILAISFIFLIISLHRYFIYYKLNKLTNFNEEHIEIICKKVRILTRQISRISSVIIGIIIKDENNKKYYFITYEMSVDMEKGIKEELLNNKITITCYEGSNFIIYY